MTIALRLAGFEIRDTLMWLYGTGFPKSLDVAKAIDRALGAEGQRQTIGLKTKPDGTLKSAADFARTAGSVLSGLGQKSLEEAEQARHVTAPATDEARQWEGWGTALKPAYEPIILARKPFTGTVAHCVTTHGTSAINIDATRIGDEGGTRSLRVLDNESSVTFARGVNGGHAVPIQKGRWPTNVIIDDNITEQLGPQKRFFYVPKASTREREAGLERVAGQRRNIHPTVKPIELMRYLVRMITPPEGVVLDPFAGSGSTLCAAALEGCKYFGIECEAEYIEIARERVAHWSAQRPTQDILTSY
jgi:site-specific DNA-methyltransferase (adenine-specific)